MVGTIKAEVRTELVVSRSRFITILSPITSTEAARDVVGEARAEFPDARHHCSAWIHRIAGESDREHSSDDGEPSGTAGRPMLAALAGHDLTDVVAVVVRYFGGVLLGTGGLVRAYTDSVDEAVRAATVYDLVETARWSFTCHPGAAGRLEAALRAQDYPVEVAWGSLARLTVTTNNRERLSAVINTELANEVDLEAAGVVDMFTIREGH